MEIAEFHSIVYDIILNALKKSEYFKERDLIRTRNEILPDLKRLSLISEDEYIQSDILEIGEVIHCTEGYIIIAASLRAPLLELDTRVCMENRLVVGIIDDIIGSVENPHYSILGYQTVPSGTMLYYPRAASILSSLSRKHGTDASNYNDEETSEESSDEEIVKKVNLCHFSVIK